MNNKYSVNCKYDTSQYKRAMGNSKDPIAFKKNLLNIIVSDLAIEKDTLSKFFLIKDKLLPISLASEILKYEALSKAENALIKLIYKDELATSLMKSIASVTPFDFIQYFLKKELSIGDRKLLLDLFPLLKKELPSTTKLIEKKINEEGVDVIYDLLEDFSHTFEKKSDELKLYQMLNEGLKLNNSLAIKIFQLLIKT